MLFNSNAYDMPMKVFEDRIDVLTEHKELYNFFLFKCKQLFLSECKQFAIGVIKYANCLY